MDFEEWLEEYREYKNRSDADWYPTNVQIFEAGQQSKQEEVNKLQKEIDGLKKSIDRALELLNEFNCPTEYGVEDVWKAASILTGESNE